MAPVMMRQPTTISSATASRLLGLLLVFAVFFVLPAAVFLRLSGTTGSTRVAVQITALTFPATGALVLRLNPALVPDRATLGALPLLAWVALAVALVAILATAWWLAGVLGPPAVGN
jgi:hypothetical protein